MNVHWTALILGAVAGGVAAMMRGSTGGGRRLGRLFGR